MSRRARWHPVGTTGRVPPAGRRPTPGPLRVNEVLREVVAEELERLADTDERLRLLTVTSVDTSPDLRHATVYLSSLADEAAEALAERRAQLQRADRAPGADEAHAAAAVRRRPGRGGRRSGSRRSCAASRATAGDPAGRRRRRDRMSRVRRPPSRIGHGGGGQGAGLDLARRGGPLPPHLRPAPGGPRRHPRPRRHRRAAGRARPGHPAAALPDRPAQDLHGRGRARDGHHHPRRLGRGDRDAGTCPGSPWPRSGRPPPALTGDIEQVPPMVSAVKVGGRRLHELARAGIEVERAPRPVTVAPLRRASRGGPSPACSASRWTARRAPTCGSLAADLGPALGGGAHLRNLRRTRGRFVHRGRRPPARRRSDPAHVLSPAAGAARPRPRSRSTPRSPTWSPTACPSTGCRWAPPATDRGPWSTTTGRLLAVYEATETDRMAGGACWPASRSTRPAGRRCARRARHG